MADNRNPPNEDDPRNPGSDRIQHGYEAKLNGEKAANLQDREKAAGSQASGEQEGTSTNAASRADTTGNIRSVGGHESEGSGWKTRVSGGGPKKKKGTAIKAFLKKKGAIGLLVGIFTGAGFGLGGLVLPGGALIHVKEAIVEKLDSLTPVTEQRAMLSFSKKVKATNATCKIKVKCRYKGISPKELERIRLQGADIVDSKGKPITCKGTKCVGGHTIVMQNGEKIPASKYTKTVRTNATLYKLTRETFPRYSGWNLKNGALKIRDKFKLITDPKWGDPGDDKSTRQAIHAATVGDNETGDAEVVNNDETEKGDDGKEKPKAGSDSIDFGDSGDDIAAETADIEEKIGKGEKVDPIPTDITGATSMDEFKGSFSAKKGFQKALSFANPASLVVGLCTTYQLTSSLVFIAHTIEVANDMRYASQFVSSADKYKYGLGNTSDIEKAMTILEREDIFGNAFGDSAAYQYALYGVVPAIGVAASAAGNAVLQILETALDYVNDHVPGGKHAVRIGCGIATNTAVQIGLSLTTFIPGAGQLAKGITKAIEEGGKDAALAFIKAEIKKITDSIAEKASKQDVKNLAKNASVKFAKMAYGPLGMYLAGYILGKYAVPYAARQLASAMLTGDEDGRLSMDSIGSGFNATAAATSSETGLKALTKKEAAIYTPFENDSKARYEAYMRQSSNPLDINNPYSASNSFGTALVSFGSKFKGFGDILTAPAAILSSLNPGGLLTSNALADDNQDQECTTLHAFEDNDIASTPFCQADYGLLNLDVDQDAIIDYLYAHKQIDGDGNAVSDSDLDKFLNKCVIDSGGKGVPDIGGDEYTLDKSCYKDESPDVTLSWTDEDGKPVKRTLSTDNVYRLYRVDSLEADDDPISDDNSTGFYDTVTPMKELTRNTQ